ncbi:lipopolysaccharide biosynthesis protein [Acinetobacter guillouiae]|uniref:lipopolysaccharide biosynthesis protein n=1 Tax=Acinetobacter guillouiae TaxID=106649 RepID=UPI001AE8CB9C|nr:oligosaccharide flippase family protein [Acinetobacter guillouiae]MBP2546895.1 O-antigen/teichoic acid export membrane protein [Acinetobacter guillouiae]
MIIINSNSNLIKILSNYIGKMWSLISVFIFVPVYIHFLGVENYAIIGLYSLILALISFADAGMSSAITREFSLDENSFHKLNILKKLEKIYWSILIVICCGIILTSGIIAKKWLVSETISNHDLQNYVILIGVGTCIQMASSLYFGALFGLGKQVKANSFQVLWTTSRSLLVVLLFICFKPSLYIFLVWQIVCNFIYIIILRLSVVNFLDIKNKADLKNKLVLQSVEIPTRIMKYLGGMTLVAIISAVNSQADKLIISYFYSLKIFGYYTMVSTLAQIPVFITMPMASFVFPLLTKFSDNKYAPELFEVVFKKFVFFLYLIIIPTSIMLCFYPIEILSLWIRSGIDTQFLLELPILTITLVLGSLFLAMQFPFYYTLLANSQTKYTVYQGIVQILIGVPLLFYFAKLGELRYVGISWLLINLSSLIYLIYICFNKYLKIKVFYFINYFLIPPLFVSMLVGVIGYYLYLHTQIPFYFVVVPSTIFIFLIILVWNNYCEDRNFLAFKHLYDFPRG